ncbi:MAG: hypothetical protein J7J98_03850 [candidate division Zixibacteria bacterium]|nr:hypothetical protein [candidate division Zixibacteria bacterium]
MNYYKIAILLVLLLVATVSGQDEDTLPVGAVPERSIIASSSAEAFRPIGEYRVWRYFGNQTTLGQITSIVKGFTEIGGQQAMIVDEAMRLDYTLLGGDRKIIAEGTSYLSNSGRYIGSDLNIGDTVHVEHLKLTCTGDGIEGSFTRAGTDQSVEMVLDCDRFFWDFYMVDQLEFYLAMQDIQIGTRLDDSIFQPQSLMSTKIAGQVVYFMYQEIYKGKFDSVFVIRLTKPGDYQLYLTPDKKLVRVDMIQQGIRVYQDIVGVSTAAARAKTEQKRDISHLLLKLPHYVAFILVTAVAMLFFSVAAFRWPQAYLFFGGGGILFLAIPFIVNPLILRIVENWLSPALAEGDSLYVVGIVPSLIVGIAQTGLIWGGIFWLIAWLAPKEYRLIGLGAFLGGGFALAEACYGAGLQVTILFDWPLAERIAFILLRVISGGLIGWVFTNNVERRWMIPGLILPVAVVARYLPLLVQGGLIDVEVIHFVLVVGMVLYLLAAMLLIKKVPARTMTDAESY